MRKQVAVVAAIAALAVPVVAAESAGNESCPDGQELVGFTAQNFKAEQKPLPEGFTIRDEAGAVRVESDRDSATGNVPLTIECR